jgi:hypothetical protein
MPIRTVKDVACTPFAAHTVEAQTTASGFVHAQPRTNLSRLQALADHVGLNIKKGDYIFVPLDFANSPWGKRKLTHADIAPDFILVPVDNVVAILST